MFRSAIIVAFFVDAQAGASRPHTCPIMRIAVVCPIHAGPRIGDIGAEQRPAGLTAGIIRVENAAPLPAASARTYQLNKSRQRTARRTSLRAKRIGRCAFPTDLIVITATSSSAKGSRR